jgi:hypothetical protein
LKMVKDTPNVKRAVAAKKGGMPAKATRQSGRLRSKQERSKSVEKQGDDKLEQTITEEKKEEQVSENEEENSEEDQIFGHDNAKFSKWEKMAGKDPISPYHKRLCLEILTKFQVHEHGRVFNNPVDPVALGLPDYFEIIKNPMDLGTIRTKLHDGHYRSVDDFRKDIKLTFKNAETYNRPGSSVHDMALNFWEQFELDFAQMSRRLHEEDDRLRRQQNDLARASPLAAMAPSSPPSPQYSAFSALSSSTTETMPPFSSAPWSFHSIYMAESFDAATYGNHRLSWTTSEE